MTDQGSNAGDGTDETAEAGQEDFDEMIDDVEERVRRTTEVVEEHEEQADTEG